MDIKQISNYLKLNFIISSGKNISGIATTFLLLPLVIGRIGIEIYGIISLTLLFSGVSSIADLGLSKALVTMTGNNKVCKNRVFTAAFIINMAIIFFIIIFFIISKLLSIKLLGNNLIINKDDELLLINVSFLILIFTIVNNLLRSVLEANYLLHLVSMTFAVYNPLLYAIIILVSFFTLNIKFFIIIPLFVTVLVFLLNIYLIRKKKIIKLVKIKTIHLKYLFKVVLSFLNIGLVNSMVTPSLRFFFILKVSDTALYGVFDLAFKIAQSLNGVIGSIATPMLAVFANKKIFHAKQLIKLSYNIFYISIAILICCLFGYYLFGEYLIDTLKIEAAFKNSLYETSIFLMLAIGLVSSVEVFLRYFMGNGMLRKIFILKLLIPILCIVFYFYFEDLEYLYRIIYSYSWGLIISAFSTLIYFKKETIKLKEIL